MFIILLCGLNLFAADSNNICLAIKKELRENDGQLVYVTFTDGAVWGRVHIIETDGVEKFYLDSPPLLNADQLIDISNVTKVAPCEMTYDDFILSVKGNHYATKTIETLPNFLALPEGATTGKAASRLSDKQIPFEKLSLLP